MTVNSLVKEYDDLMAFQNLAISTRENYAGHVRRYLRHFRRDPKEIGFEEAKAYLLQLKGSKLRDQAKFAIAKFYNEVVKVLMPFTSIPNGKRGFKLPNCLSQEECMRIFGAIDNLKHRTVIQLIYAGGLRLSEPTRIRIRHLSSAKQTLFVEQSKGAKDREIPLPVDTWNLVLEYYRKFFSAKGIRVTKDTFLFGGQGNDFYSKRSIQNVLGAACRKAGILKRVTVHTLRHSRATHLVMGGMDIHTLAEFLGHWDIRTTRVYLHTSKEDMRHKVADADARLQLLLMGRKDAQSQERYILEQVRALINGRGLVTETGKNA